MSEKLKDKCPVCSGYLFDDDDIVYCPECGKPYHRDCFLSVGKCIIDHDNLQESEQRNDTKEQNNTVICKNCGKEMPNDTNFCPYCGKSSDPINEDLPEGIPTMFKVFSTVDKLGGVDKNETFDGVSAEDIGNFVGPGAIKTLPMIKKMSVSGKNTNWNLIAFICPSAHALFRKMGLATYCYLLLELLAYCLFAPITYALLGSDILLTDTSTLNAVMTVLENPLKYANALSLILAVVGAIIFIGIRFYAGFYNDYLYKNHIISSIKNIREYSEDEEEDFQKKGGARPLLSLLLFMLLLYFGSYIPEFIGGLLLS